MNKFFNENKKIFIIILSISIIIPIILLTSSPIGIIEYETSLTLIGYCGSILGGFLTLYGVWWTIKDQEVKRYEDLALQYKPILRAIPPVYDDEKIIITKSDNKLLLFNIILYIENIGRGEALDIEISHSKCNHLDEDLRLLQRNEKISICEHFKEISISATELECLPVNNSKQIMIQLIVSRYYEKKDVFCFNLDIKFKNTFSKRITHHHGAKIVIRNNKSLGLKNYHEDYSSLITNKYYTK